MPSRQPQRPSGGSQRPRRDLDQHLAQRVGRLRHAHVLGHRQDGPADGVVALVGLQFTGEDAQDRALADPVGTDERSVLARCDSEADVEEQ